MKSNIRRTLTHAVVERIAAPLQAIASPQRVAILLAIGKGEACVCHLEAALGWRQPYLSQHLMELRSAGILKHRREGRYIFYRLSDESMLELVSVSARLGRVRMPAETAGSGSRRKASCPCPQCNPAPSTIGEQRSV